MGLIPSEKEIQFDCHPCRHCGGFHSGPAVCDKEIINNLTNEVLRLNELIKKLREESPQ